jgi:hypothetical protein
VIDNTLRDRTFSCSAQTLVLEMESLADSIVGSIFVRAKCPAIKLSSHDTYLLSITGLKPTKLNNPFLLFVESVTSLVKLVFLHRGLRRLSFKVGVLRQSCNQFIDVTFM